MVLQNVGMFEGPVCISSYLTNSERGSTRLRWLVAYKRGCPSAPSCSILATESKTLTTRMQFSVAFTSLLAALLSVAFAAPPVDVDGQPIDYFLINNSH